MIKLDLKESFTTYDVINFTVEQQNLLMLLLEEDKARTYTQTNEVTGYFIDVIQAGLYLLQKEDENGKPTKFNVINEQQKEQIIDILIECKIAFISRITLPKRHAGRVIYFDIHDTNLTLQESHELTYLIKHFHNLLVCENFITINANIDNAGYCEKMFSYIIDKLSDFIFELDNYDINGNEAEEILFKRMIILLEKMNQFFYNENIMVIMPTRN